MLATFDGVQVQYAIAPAEKYGTCALQYDRLGVSRLTETGNNNLNTEGAPDTLKLPIPNSKSQYVSLTEPIQKWMYGMMRSRIPSTPEVEAKQSWRSLLMGNNGDGNNRTQRAFTDFKGSGTHADYINMAQLDSEPIGLNYIICGGAVLKILGSDDKRTIKTTDCWKVEAIDPLSDVTKYHPATHPWLFFFPTISIRKPEIDARTGKSISGKFAVEFISQPFPQFKDKSVMPVFGQKGEPFIFVPKDRMKVLTGKRPSPFRNSTIKGYESTFYADPYPVGWLQ